MSTTRSGAIDVGAQLHQQVGAARQNPRIATGFGKQRNRGVKRIGCFITHWTLDFP